MDLHVSVRAETLWSIDLGPLGELNITNSFVMMILVMALLIIGGAIIARKASIDRPGYAQSGFEMVVEFLLNLVEGAAGHRVGRRIFPLIGSLFIFIIVANYSGLLPGVGTLFWEEGSEEAIEEAALVASSSHATSDSVAYAAPEEEEHGEEAHHEPPAILRPPNADLNMTLAMALVAFTAVQVAGVSAHGVVGRFKHLGDPPFMFPIEVISEVSRIISLSFRLFGNIFAGEVLVGVMVAMSVAILELTNWIAFPLAVLPTIFLILEVLFGFIQALIFALLTLIYITLATAGHDDHGHIEEPHDAHWPQTVRAGAGD